MCGTHALQTLGQLSACDGEWLSCVYDVHTKLAVRRFESTRFIDHGVRVSTVSLVGIEVHAPARRQGRAAKAVRALRRAASDHKQMLVVENVVSDHMHKLLAKLGAEPLPGSRPGRHGCHYWLPPR